MNEKKDKMVDVKAEIIAMTGSNIIAILLVVILLMLEARFIGDYSHYSPIILLGTAIIILYENHKGMMKVFRNLFGKN